MPAKNKIDITLTANDKASGVLKGVAANARKFAKMAGVAVVGAMGASINAAADFEARMSDISTLLTGDSAEAIAQFKDGILGLVKTIPKSADDLGASAYAIVSAGISDTAQAMQVLEDSGRLATAGLSTTAEATDIMTSAINAFGYSADQSGMISDILFKTVKNGKTTVSEMSQAFGAAAPIMASANVELSEFSAATAALTTSGLPAAQAQNALRQAVVSLQKPTADMRELMDKLGFESGETAISQFGLVGVMEKIDKAAEGNSETLGKAWGSVEALGAATSLTSATSEAFVTTLEDMEDGARAVDSAFEKQQKSTSAQMAILRNNIDVVAISLGDKLLPIVNDFVTYLINDVGPALARMGQWISDNKAVLATLAGAVIGATTAMMAFKAIVVTTTIVTSAYTAASSVLSAVMAVQAQGLGVLRAAWFVLNTVMAANPIGLAIVAAGLLVGALAGLSMATHTQKSAQESANEEMQRAVDLNRELKDMEARLEDQRLALEGSTLGVERAQRTLNETVTLYGEDSLEAREAALNLKTAQKRLNDQQAILSESTQELTDKQKEHRDMIAGVIVELDKLDGKSVHYTIDGEERVVQKVDGGIVDTGTYADGGYTGMGGKNEVAGIVHRGEYVIPREQVNQSTGLPMMGSTININGSINLGDRGAVDRFFQRIDAQQQLAAAGMS